MEEGAIVDFSWMNKKYKEQLIETINLILRNVPMFTTVYNSVKNSPEIFRFNIYGLEDISYIDKTTGGFFRKADDITKELTFLDFYLHWALGITPEIKTIEAGEESNPHYIKFAPNINTVKEYEETTVKDPATVFEEIFHGAQYLYYRDIDRSGLYIETEVKIAIGYVRYCNGGYYGDKFKEWNNKDEWGATFFSINPETKEYIYGGILDYYNALKNNQGMTNELKQKFKKDIIRYAKEVVYPSYNPSKQWGEAVLNAYDGNVEYFNYLTK